MSAMPARAATSGYSPNTRAPEKIEKTTWTQRNGAETEIYPSLSDMTINAQPSHRHSEATARQPNCGQTH